MPKTLNQHQIRRRAVQALFSYKVQNDMATTVVSEFRKNVESLEAALSQPIRFEVEYRDERITVRKFPKQLSKPLEAIAGIYDILGVENVEKTAVTKAMTFMRDFGGLTKKMNEYEANDLFKGIMANLKLVKLFQIDLDDEAPVAPKVLEFLRALPQDSTSEQALATFQKIFSMLHENILEKYTLDLFTPVQLQNELDEKLSQAELKAQAQTDELLRKTKVFVLNYDNDAPEAIEAPEYFTTLVDGILANSTTLEAELSKYLAKNWSFARLTLVEQSLLLVAAYEIMFTDTPDVVAVNEAIELSKDFSDEKSSRFVNGVLTNLVK
ncbi:transcription antitermination factor NusB [Lactococcus protaetiae]|uniref:Transcription antitermination protein NusB n=1 Tax=Lactococcus protaetiae TaxID=2592653 RepID=A0A514Z8B0_9LACT|nr:transcription antitermination factor NusB [Lactococcus protaetiae]QDK70826.1 transcription antitermination factor NusB [Lactococcus protaetiae]